MSWMGFLMDLDIVTNKRFDVYEAVIVRLPHKSSSLHMNHVLVCVIAVSGSVLHLNNR